MPLIKGKSQKSFVKNLKTEMESGKPQKQSLAIAYAMKRKAGKKMADGGGVQDAQDSMRKAFHYADGDIVMDPDLVSKWNSGFAPKAPAQPTPEPSPTPKAHGGFIEKEKKSGYESHEGNTQRPNGVAHSEDNKGLNQQSVDMQASTSSYEQGYTDALMGKKSKNFSGEARLAEGGYADGSSGDGNYMDDEQSLVDRIMYQRSKSFSDEDRYSKGGQVANDVGTGQEADKLPNQYDDLVLRDDLESSYGDDDNSGDSLDNAQEDEDRKDIVARIMASRRKKDRLPNPA